MLRAATARATEKQATDARSGDPNHYQTHGPSPCHDLETLGLWPPEHAVVSSQDGATGSAVNVAPTCNNRASTDGDDSMAASCASVSRVPGRSGSPTALIHELPPATSAAIARVHKVGLLRLSRALRGPCGGPHSVVRAARTGRHKPRRNQPSCAQWAGWR